MLENYKLLLGNIPFSILSIFSVCGHESHDEQYSTTIQAALFALEIMLTSSHFTSACFYLSAKDFKSKKPGAMSNKAR
jgi:hypothetical protein